MIFLVAGCIVLDRYDTYTYMPRDFSVWESKSQILFWTFYMFSFVGHSFGNFEPLYFFCFHFLFWAPLYFTFDLLCKEKGENGNR